jgi:hypothetical protein
MEKTEHDFYRRGSGEAGGLLGLVILGLIIWGIASLFGFNYHGTSEGTIQYNDCREIIQIQPDSWHTYFGTFVCDYAKTQSGQIMGGQCVRIVNDSSLFSNSSACATAYVYEAPAAPVCKNNTYPYLGYDDMCYTMTQY